MSVSGTATSVSRIEDWQLGFAPAGSDESGLAPASIRWASAVVPGTVAGSIRELGEWDLDSTPRAFDSEEWWFRSSFDAEPVNPGERMILIFEGLATLARVWLNGQRLFESENMFLAHRCNVSNLLADHNEILIRFAPLDRHLEVRRKRARWRTPMVSHQQLRWIRTTLLGRTPGWSPPAAAVGPWRPVWLERQRSMELGPVRLTAVVTAGSGRLTVDCPLLLFAPTTLDAARVHVLRNGRQLSADLAYSVETQRLTGAVDIPSVDLWWPHTHGAPALYEAFLELSGTDANGNSSPLHRKLGTVGFRTLELDQTCGRFRLKVNGCEIFCRGAAWTPLDCVSLQATSDALDDAFDQVCAAGMNMLRVAGPCVYEAADFLDRCDSRGVLLWQDFMFANMDYPIEDAAFLASVQAEAEQQLSRWQGRPALAILCGSSEGAQQAAMSGASRECWAPMLFEVELAALAARYRPDVPYIPSSTHGGAFPFQASSGVTSYYGVGAYLRPPEDARRSDLRFASECLAFANVPEEETLARLAGSMPLRSHHPRWKERVPRDMGAGWDFDDVRDHYLATQYRVDPVALRYADQDRYLRLSRAVTGEVMAGAFAEWRRAGSGCGGALIWFLRDLWPGAGWGVIDSTGLPKAAYYHLRRVLKPLALFITDEGTNGLLIHATNDSPVKMRTRLSLQLYRLSKPVGAVRVTEWPLEGGSVRAMPATDAFEGFVDLSYAFRFGPPAYDVLHAMMLDGSDEPIAEAFHFSRGPSSLAVEDVGVSSSLLADDDGYQLEIRTQKFAQSVHVEIPGFIVEDQYFHMTPGAVRRLKLRAQPGASAPEGYVHALNAAAPSRISQPT